jgi:hypothetical protein
MKLLPFLHEFGDHQTIVSTLRDISLLRRSYRCDICSQNMLERTSRVRDGIMFECCKRTCRRSKSIRAGSFFDQSRLTLCECMLFLHLWSRNYSEKLICDDFNFSNNTVVDWARFCRDLCVYEFENTDSIIGGPGAVVEIDETVVVKRKYNRGRVLRDGWLFGGIERRDDGIFNSFLCLVYDRSAPHLTHLIRQHVAPGTHIITDGWAAYSRLSEHGYTHSVVIHEDNFVSPDDANVHTQLIEATWGSLKRFIRSRGTHKGHHLLEYISEYVFRRRFPDVFEALLRTIMIKYPFSDQ